MRKEIEKIIRDVGEKGRYEDIIGGVKVQPILWSSVPKLATDQICELIVERLEKLKDEVCFIDYDICSCTEDIDNLIKDIKGE